MVNRVTNLTKFASIAFMVLVAQVAYSKPTQKPGPDVPSFSVSTKPGPDVPSFSVSTKPGPDVPSF
ncbi:hypothetical protein KBD08_02105 [Candidatus Babeliales bacterium]|nr:hypothetical protein [Candidatus Babeliales bacterium]